MKILVPFFVVTFSIFLVSCSSPTESIEDLVSVTKMSNQLKITNNSRETIYFFAVEQETAALIDWTPHFGDNIIKKNSFTIINYSTIENRSGKQLSTGNNVILYYWDTTDKTNPNIFNTVIKL